MENLKTISESDAVRLYSNAETKFYHKFNPYSSHLLPTVEPGDGNPAPTVGFVTGMPGSVLEAGQAKVSMSQNHTRHTSPPYTHPYRPRIPGGAWRVL